MLMMLVQRSYVSTLTIDSTLQNQLLMRSYQHTKALLLLLPMMGHLQKRTGRESNGYRTVLKLKILLMSANMELDSILFITLQVHDGDNPLCPGVS